MAVKASNIRNAFSSDSQSKTSSFWLSRYYSSKLNTTENDNETPYIYLVSGNFVTVGILGRYNNNCINFLPTYFP